MSAISQTSHTESTRTYHAREAVQDWDGVVTDPGVRDTDHAVALAGEDGGRHRQEREEGEEAHIG